MRCREPLHGRGRPYILSQQVFQGSIVEHGVRQKSLQLRVLVLQRPPAYSAVKVGGRRAYDIARAGETVELAEREVEVMGFELTGREEDRATFAIECSSGTYVRVLIADLGDAYCLELRRTAIGHFDVAAADPERIVPLGDALDFLPAVTLEGEEARKAGFGVAVAGEADGIVRLLDVDGLVALAEPRPDGLLKPVVGFRSS